jgi:hypothetical protein
MGYGLDGRGSIRGKEKICLFSASPTSVLRPTQPPIQWVPEALSPEVKLQGREADHSPHVVLKSRIVELYLNSQTRLRDVVHY